MDFFFQISKVNDVDGGSYNYLIKKLMNEQMMMLSIQFDSIPYIACITVFLQSSIYKHHTSHIKKIKSLHKFRLVPCGT